MKVLMKSIFPEGIEANIDIPDELLAPQIKHIECCIDNTIPQNLNPVPSDTLRFFVTTEGWRDYNKIILDNPQAYDYLLTQYPDLLQLPNSVELIGNGSFVDPAPDIEKKFGVSIVMTNRMVAPGHPMRLELYNRRKEIKIPFDIYRGTWNGFEPTEDTIQMPPWPNKKWKVHAFDCMFHIVIEGFKNDHYYSEKLIDCLITKTVPIYWGHTKIERYFNPAGMLFVDNVDEIIGWCNYIDEGYYHELMPAIEDNYQRGLKVYKYEDILRDAMMRAIQ